MYTKLQKSKIQNIKGAEFKKKNQSLNLNKLALKNLEISTTQNDFFWLQ